MKGIWTFTLRDAKTNEIIKQEKNDNDITYLGVGYVLDNAIGRTNVANFGAGSTWIAVGTGSETFSNWASTLGTEVSGAGNLGRVVTTTEARSGYKAIISTSFNTTVGSGALDEAGIFVKGYGSGNALLTPTDAKDSGMLFNKVVMGTINKDDTNTLQIDVEVNFND